MEMAEKALLKKALWQLELLQTQLSARWQDAIEAKALLKAALRLSDQQGKATNACEAAKAVRHE